MDPEAEFMLLNPRDDTHQDQNGGHNDRPQLDMQNILVERRLRGGRDDSQDVHLYDIPCDSVVGGV